MLALEVALLCERGGRATNEDACGHWHSDRRLCCVLADGAGGHGGGDVAARLVVRHLLSAFAAGAADAEGSLSLRVREANRALIAGRESDASCRSMHATLVCLIVDFVGHRAEWAHAGDSRLYWFRAGRLLERTRDHSLVQSLVDAGLLAEEALRTHPRRSELRSALGVPEAVLEIADSGCCRSIAAGDAFLLCSDGVWEHVADSALADMLRAAASPHAWLQAIEDAVGRATRERPGHDNFTAIAVWAAAA